MEDVTETEEETGEWLGTEAETDAVAETDEVAVEHHTTSFACAISFLLAVVFAVTVFIFGWIGVVLTVSPAPATVPAPADDIGQCPTTRNRSGRRMAGRRQARPGRGRGGSKYLKRLARSGRVQRKSMDVDVDVDMGAKA